MKNTLFNGKDNDYRNFFANSIHDGLNMAWEATLGIDTEHNSNEALKDRYDQLYVKCMTGALTEDRYFLMDEIYNWVVNEKRSEN